MRPTTNMLLALLLTAGSLCGANAPAAAQSQRPVVTARIEPDSIGIGDRFDYIIEVEKDLVQVVEFPDFEGDDQHFELYRELPVDTLRREGRRLKLRKRYRLAAFEEGRYNFGRAQVLYADKNITDTLWSRDTLHLEVGTFLIDSTSQSIYDLKPQLGMPFRFAEIRGYLLWGLLVLALLGAAVWGLMRWLEARGRRIGDLFRGAPPQPPHVVAIKALERLHHQKLWQNNRHKEYYSELTDILRTYISGRWEIGAREMTTDEIVAAMRTLELPDKAAMDLVTILRNGDLVKFAKDTPDAEQNENDYLKSYYFVEETKPADDTAAADPDEALNMEN